MPLSRSHTRAVQSLDSVTARRPSRLTMAAFTPPLCTRLASRSPLFCSMHRSCTHGVQVRCREELHLCEKLRKEAATCTAGMYNRSWTSASLRKLVSCPHVCLTTLCHFCILKKGLFSVPCQMCAHLHGLEIPDRDGAVEEDSDPHCPIARHCKGLHSAPGMTWTEPHHIVTSHPIFTQSEPGCACG